MWWLGRPKHILCEEDPKTLAMDKYLMRYPQGRARAGKDDRPIGQIMATLESVNPTLAQSDVTTVVCTCGKVCKNVKGLMIHQAKMGCLCPGSVQRTGKPGETQERQGPVPNHSTQNLQAHSIEGGGNTTPDVPSRVTRGQSGSIQQHQQHRHEAGKQAINWPTTQARKEWERFDCEMNEVLEHVLAGELNRKMKAMASIIWSIGAERFGVKQTKTHQPRPVQQRENRRIKEIKLHRADRRRHRKAFIQAEEEEKQALKEIWDTLRERIKTLRRAEYYRRDRRRRAKQREQFTKNPFAYLSKLLGDKRSGQLQASREVPLQHAQ